MEWAGLDYGIEKRSLFTSKKSYALNGERLIVQDHFATVRTDTEAVLGVVGNDYRIVQNVEAFSFFDSIVRGEGIRYETAGALGRGERILLLPNCLPTYA